MAFPVLAVPVPGSPTFNVDAQLFASGMATFAQAANALGSVIDLSLTSTSTTSLAIGTGSKTLSVQLNLGYVIGHPLRIASIANPSNFMDGIVTAYNILTGSLTVNVLSVGGSGTIASWNTMVLPGGGNFASLSNNKYSGRQVLADEVTIASASTLDFTTGNSNQFVITGTTTVTAVTMDQGAVIKARCTGACPFTHGANLQVQGSANYTASSGDIFTFTFDGTVVRVEISTGNGSPVAKENTASDSNYTSTSSSKAITPEWALGRFGTTRHGRTSFSGAYVPAVGETLSRSHGLSVKPSRVLIIFKCLVADLGYSVGDTVTATGQWNGSAASPLMACGDSTNCFIKCASTNLVYLSHKTTGAAVTPTSNAWEYAFEFTY